MVPLAPSRVELSAALRTRITEFCRRDLSRVFALWLLREPASRSEFAAMAALMAKREGADQDFQTIAILGLAADAGLLSQSETMVLRSSLDRLAGRAPVVNGVPMGFCVDAVGILGVALGAAAIADQEITRRVADWAARFLKSSYERDRAEDWERCLIAAADRKLGHPLGLPMPNSATTSDVRIALLSVDLLDDLDSQPPQDEAFTLALAGQNLPEEFNCEQAALRLKALEWVSHARLPASTAEELGSPGSSEVDVLRRGPDVHVFWGPYWTGGMLSFRNEGTESAKNVRLQCSAEDGWRPIIRPEVVASISPGATVRVVDVSRDKPEQGKCIADFVHSLPSKEHTMTIAFEDRLGEKRTRDFRVVAAAGHGATETLAVTFYPGSLRRSGIPRVLKNLVDRARRFRDAAEINRILNPARANADPGNVAESGTALRAQDQRGPRKVQGGREPARRNPKYKLIDVALKEIAESRPRTQEEVFQSLEGRRVAFPQAEPFLSARGWTAGFSRAPAAARAWLSKRWAELALPPLPRGPKNSRK